MVPERAQRLAALGLQGLAGGFLLVGLLFVLTPDGTLHRLDVWGEALGDFSPSSETDDRLWLALGVAYMTVITGLALVASTDVVRYRPMLLVLAAGKAVSSLAAGAYFWFEEDVFAYLLNFIVDGSLVFTVLGLWVLAGRAESRAPD